MSRMTGALHRHIWCVSMGKDYGRCRASETVLPVTMLDGTMGFPLPEGWEMDFGNNQGSEIRFWCPVHRCLTKAVSPPLLPTEREQLEARIRLLEAQLEVEMVTRP